AAVVEQRELRLAARLDVRHGQNHRQRPGEIDDAHRIELEREPRRALTVMDHGAQGSAGEIVAAEAEGGAGALAVPGGPDAPDSDAQDLCALGLEPGAVLGGDHAAT